MKNPEKKVVGKKGFPEGTLLWVRNHNTGNGPSSMGK